MLEDFRFAFRNLRRRPAWVAVAVATLGLGIGADTAIFSVVDAVLLRPLPYPEPHRLVMVWETMGDWTDRWVAPANFFDWREQADSFEGLAAFSTTLVNVTGEGEPERLAAQIVTAGFFDVLGVQPVLGRGFRSEDDREAGLRTAVLSHSLWQRRYGGAADVVGRTVEIDGERHAVIGVLGRGFDFEPEAWLWVLGDDGAALRFPFLEDVDLSTLRGDHMLSVVGRLAPGAGLGEARAEVSAIAARLAADYPETNAGLGASVVPLAEEVVGDVRPKLVILLAAVGLLLLLACANVAHLTLARARERRRELAIRTALGAPRRRLTRLLLAESLLVSAAGGAVGVLVALWLGDLFVAANPGGVPRLEGAGLEFRGLVFCAGVTLAAGLAFGLLPALKAARASSPGEESARSTATPGRRRGRNVLVVGEVAIAQVLLVGAGLLALSFHRLVTVDPGFESRNLLTFELSLSAERYATPEQKAAFFDEVLERLAALPGARSAAAVTRAPFQGAFNRGFLVEGRPDPGPDEDHTVDFQIVSPGSFATLGARILRGRDLTAADGVGEGPAAVVNEAAARRYWPGEEPLGRRIRFRSEDPWHTVVGIAADIRHRGLAEAPRPTAYVSYHQNRERWWSLMSFLVRTEVPAAELAGAARAAVHEIDPRQPVSQLSTMGSRMRRSVAARQLLLLLVGGFAATALLLAAVGIAGVVGYSTARRSREIAIRLAVGGRRWQILRLILGESLAVGAAGVALGAAAALALMRFLEAELFRVSAADPRIFAAIAVLLLGVTLAAAYAPARRASRLDPTTALRQE